MDRQMADYELPKGDGSKWQSARLVTLEEIPQEDLKIDKDGWINVEIAPKKIYTIELQA